MTKRKGQVPTKEEILAARERAGLTRAEAAKLIYMTSERAWQKWEYGERRMHPALWEFFKLKVKERRTREAYGD